MINEKELFVSKSTVTVLPLIILIAGIIEIWLTYMGVFGSIVSWYGSEPDTSFAIYGVILIVLAVVLFICTFGCEVHLTDKRVYGRGMLGKQVDIPIDSISSVGRISWLKGIIISSSSGSLRFVYINNDDELYATLSGLLITRQRPLANSIEQSSSLDRTDELKKYKDLLDQGVITQEEFDAKKKQLLGL